VAGTYPCPNNTKERTIPTATDDTGDADDIFRLAQHLTPSEQDELILQLWTAHQGYATTLAEVERVLAELALRGAKHDDPDVIRARGLRDRGVAAVADTDRALKLVTDLMVTQQTDEYWNTRTRPDQP
jgi:hypothetical protein